jgi:hypothetical protein
MRLMIDTRAVASEVATGMGLNDGPGRDLGRQERTRSIASAWAVSQHRKPPSLIRSNYFVRSLDDSTGKSPPACRIDCPAGLRRKRRNARA